MNVLDGGGPGPGSGRKVSWSHLGVEPLLVLVIVLEVAQWNILVEGRSRFGLGNPRGKDRRGTGLVTRLRSRLRSRLTKFPAVLLE